MLMKSSGGMSLPSTYYHGCGFFGVSDFYYLDPPVVWCFLFCFLCLADKPRIFGSNKWTTEPQLRFYEICSNLVKARCGAVSWWKRLFTLKKPKTYFVTTTVSLAEVA